MIRKGQLQRQRATWHCGGGELSWKSKVSDFSADVKINAGKSYIQTHRRTIIHLQPPIYTAALPEDKHSFISKSTFSDLKPPSHFLAAGELLCPSHSGSEYMEPLYRPQDSSLENQNHRRLWTQALKSTSHWQIFYCADIKNWSKLLRYDRWTSRSAFPYFLSTGGKMTDHCLERREGMMFNISMFEATGNSTKRLLWVIQTDFQHLCSAKSH